MATTYATRETDLVRVLEGTYGVGTRPIPIAVAIAGEAAFCVPIHAPDAFEQSDSTIAAIARFFAACSDCREAVEIPALPLRMMSTWVQMDLVRSYAIDSPNGLVDTALSTGLWPSTHRRGQDVTPRQRKALERLNDLLDEIGMRLQQQSRELSRKGTP